MIVVLVAWDMAPEDRERFVAARAEQAARSVNETGCIEYAFSYDAADDSRVRLTERWESQAALDAHIAALGARGPIVDDPPLRSRSFTVIEGTVTS